MKSILRISLLGIAAIAASCSNHGPHWHIEGAIQGLSDGDNVILEGNNQGYWYVIDTIKTGNDGALKYAGDLHGYPDIFRLRVGNSSLYFPIDSAETVTIIASAPDIANNHKLSGSPQADNMAKVDSLITASIAANGVNSLPYDAQLKKQLGQMILSDPAGVVSYYIISKTIGNTPLYNPANAMDLRIIGAVANSYNQMRPEDPRTKYLTSLFLRNRRQTTTGIDSGSKIQTKLIKAYEIDLYDNTGKRHSLTELTESGKPVILNFTAYSTDWSPAFNIELNKVYSKYHPQGLEIYQVSLDNDEYTWRQAAKNLPWITVYNDIANGDKILRQYNVREVPTTFIFNRSGELVERVLDINDLEASVTKVM